MKKFLFLLISITLFGCTDTSNVLPRFTGSTGEIVVVVKKSVWNAELGKSIQDFFFEAVPHLPQPEARYYLGQYEPEGFNNLLRQHRNVFVINIDNKLPKNDLNLIRSKWSKGQVVVKLDALSEADAVTLFNERKEAILDLYNQAERERLQSKYYGKTKKLVKEKLAAQFAIRLQLPDDMLEANSGDSSVIWLKRERQKYLSNKPHDITQGIVVYSFPYTSDSTFTNDYAITARNTFVSCVHSEADWSYMTTETDFYPPTGELIQVDGKPAYYSTGLWRMEKDFMGGPFVNLLLLDEKNQQVIGVDAFVFAPKFNKREYVRELEAMVMSVVKLENKAKKS